MYSDSTCKLSELDCAITRVTFTYTSMLKLYPIVQGDGITTLRNYSCLACYEQERVQCEQTVMTIFKQDKINVTPPD